MAASASSERSEKTYWFLRPGEGCVYENGFRLLSLSTTWGEFSVLLLALRWATVAHLKVHNFKNIFKPSNLKVWLATILITIN